MTDDDLSRRLRRLVDHAAPVRLDEVTQPRRASALRRVRPALVVGVLSAVAILAGVLLVRANDGREEQDLDVISPTVPSTAPPPTTGPAPTTVPTATTIQLPPDPAEFVGITDDGRLVVIDVATGEEIRELAQQGDPDTPGTPDVPIPPNHISFAEVVPGSPAQVLYNTCCEPATAETFGIGIDGSPTTVPVNLAMGNGDFLFYGEYPAVNEAGEVATAVAPGAGAVSTFPIGDHEDRTYLDPDTSGALGGPAWIGVGAVAYVTFPDDDGSALRVLLQDDEATVLSWDAPDGTVWTHPVGYGERIIVAEQCCGADPHRVRGPGPGGDPRRHHRRGGEPVQLRRHRRGPGPLREPGAARHLPRRPRRPHRPGDRRVHRDRHRLPQRLLVGKPTHVGRRGDRALVVAGARRSPLESHPAWRTAP